MKDLPTAGMLVTVMRLMHTGAAGLRLFMNKTSSASQNIQGLAASLTLSSSLVLNFISLLKKKIVSQLASQDW